MHSRTIRRVKKMDSDSLLLLDYIAVIMCDGTNHNCRIDSSRL
jgi:hypothetical protein